MSRGLVILWTCTVALALGCPLAAWRAEESARRGAREASVRLAALRDKAAEVARLRAAAPRTAARSSEETAVTTKAARALAVAGLPNSVLASLTPQRESARAADGRELVRRKAAITLTSLGLADLGKFLGAWRREASDWVVSAIDVAPDGSVTATPGADLPLRVNMTLESLVAEPAGGAP